MKNMRGFSLVELLIVIAIFGILAGLIITAVLSSRAKANDSALKNDVRQLRLLAESVYDSQGASYKFWTKNEAIKSELDLVKADIDRLLGASGQTVLFDDQPGDYCISVPLLQAAQYACIDQLGVLVETDDACGSSEADPSIPLRCPAAN